jgi:serine/threonine protein kinase
MEKEQRKVKRLTSTHNSKLVYDYEEKKVYKTLLPQLKEDEWSSPGLNPTNLRELCVTSQVQDISPKEHLFVKMDKVHVSPENQNKISLVLHPYDCSLEHFLTNELPSGMNQRYIKKYGRQLLESVALLHEHQIIHRDLKPANLLLCKEEERLVITDFGLAKKYTTNDPWKEHTPGEGVYTLWWRPPEILMGERKYTFAADIWSVGCILVEMITNRPPFKGFSEIDTMNHHIFKCFGFPTETTWPGVSLLRDYIHLCQAHLENKEVPPEQAIHSLLGKQFEEVAGKDGISLLALLLSLDPSKRPTAREALSHPFFQTKTGATAPVLHSSSLENKTEVVAPVLPSSSLESKNKTGAVAPVLDWMMRIAAKRKVSCQSYLNACAMLSEYLKRNPILSEHLPKRIYTIGFGCLLLSSKLHDVYWLDIKTSVEMEECWDMKITTEHLIQAERDICTCLGWKLYFRTPFDYIPKGQSTLVMEATAQLLSTCQLDSFFDTFAPCPIAHAALSIALPRHFLFLKKEDVFGKKEDIFGKKEDFEKCRQRMELILLQFDHLKSKQPPKTVEAMDDPFKKLPKCSTHIYGHLSQHYVALALQAIESGASAPLSENCISDEFA